MAKTRPRLLFVDDEPSIRLTLSLYLEDQGFSVKTVATVPEALSLITQDTFDILIADLNVGQAGDGFTVVSAMRRTQPRAVTFILTGYPAFETALEAIRLQVDEYITKPTDPETLADKIWAKLAEPKPEHYVKSQRLWQVVEGNIPEITASWLAAVRADPMLAAIPMNDQARTDHIPRVLDTTLRISKGDQIGDLATRAAREHGVVRRKQGYSIPLLVRETRLLHDVIANCMQQNLLTIEISYLIPDMIVIHQTIQRLLEESVAAFLEEPTRKERIAI
ncbi:MAG TPA: response regulator [Terriglobales bacterium]|jgi:DNA-binding response OmpR family regulator|nr:response regulator [Terriglobales bacterium]